MIYGIGKWTYTTCLHLELPIYLFRHAAYKVGVPVDILLHSTITGSLHLSYRQLGSLLDDFK